MTDLDLVTTRDLLDAIKSRCDAAIVATWSLLREHQDGTADARTFTLLHGPPQAAVELLNDLHQAIYEEIEKENANGQAKEEEG